MDTQIRLLIHGYGKVGQLVHKFAEQDEDFAIASIVSKNSIKIKYN